MAGREIQSLDFSLLLKKLVGEENKSEYSLLNLLLLKTCWYLYYLLIIKIKSYFQGFPRYVHIYFVMTVWNLNQSSIYFLEKRNLDWKDKLVNKFIIAKTYCRYVVISVNIIIS